MSSTGRVIKKIVGFIIRAGLFGLILVSLLVSLLRLSFGQLPNARELIESSLSRQLDVELAIGGITGEWEVFDPVLRVTNLKLGMSNSTPVNALVLNTAELRLNVVASLLQQKIVFSHISAQQWDISLQLNRSDTNSSQFDVKQIVSILSSFESVDITGGRVQLSVDEQVYQLFDASILRTETLFRQKLQASFRLGKKNEAGTNGLDTQNISKEYEAFRFIFNLQKNDDVTGRVYVELPATTFNFSSTPWLKDYSDSIPVDNASIAGKFWLDIESSEIIKLNSQISFPHIEIQADQSLPVLISDTTLNLHWSEYPETQSDTQPPNNHSNRIGVSDLTFRINNVMWQIPPWAIKIEQEGDQYSMQADTELLEVESIAGLVQTVLGHDHTITSVLQNLNPKGVLRSPHIEIELKEGNQVNYNAMTILDDIVLEPWRGGPGVEHLDGYLVLEDSTCLLSINASPFGLYFPKLFDSKWSYQSAEGEIVWTIEEWGVSIRSGLLRLEGDHVNASGKIKIQIPYGKQEPELSLLVGVYTGTLDVRAEYLSNHPQVGSLMEWLDTSLISGFIDEGGILYQGSIQAGATQNSRNLQLVFDVKDLDMIYHPDWPELSGINGTIWVNDDELLIETSHAVTDGVKLNNVSVRGQAFDGTYTLKVVGDVQDSGAKAVKFLQKTPIFNLSPELLGQLEVSGELSASLDLTVLIKKNSVDVEYEVGLRSYKNDIRLPDYSVEFKQVEGDFLFSSKTGITSKQFTADFLGEPVTGLIETIGKEGSPTLTSVQITGLVDLNSIPHWYDMSQWPLLEGKTGFKAFLDLYYDRRSPPLLQVYSDLVGVASDYPAPLNKTADQQRRFRFSMQLNDAPLHLGIALDDDINFSLQISRDEPPRGSLILGKGVANRLRFEPIELPGFSIDGNLQQFDLEPWVDWIMGAGLDVQQIDETVPKKTNYGKDDFPINRLNLEIVDLNYGSLRLKSSKLSLKIDELGVQIKHQTALFSGDSYWYFDSNRPLSINLVNLYINTEESTKNDQITLKNIDPRTLPAIDFYARKVLWNGSDTGRWKWVFRSDENGVHLSQGSIKSADLQLDDAQVNWLISDAGATTDVQLSGRVTDIAEVMKTWGMTPALSSESGSFDIKLKSKGSPDQFSTSQKSGEIHIEAKNGSFLSGDGGSALGFTNIFNFHGLMGRLSSSFAGLDGDSTFYKSISGGLVHRGDILLIKDVIKVAGVTANFELSGLYHVDTDQLDMNMVVTLPLSKNLPWYAGFIGGLTTGVAVFVVSKLFESSIDLFSSARYRVTGSIDAPKLELDKIFATEPNAEALKLYEEYREEIQSSHRTDEQRSPSQ